MSRERAQNTGVVSSVDAPITLLSDSGGKWTAGSASPAAKLRWLQATLQDWPAPVREAERIAYYGDRAALLRCAHVAADPRQEPWLRRYNASRVLRVAIARQDLAEGVETATRYGIHEHWRNRRGSLI